MIHAIRMWNIVCCNILPSYVYLLFSSTLHKLIYHVKLTFSLGKSDIAQDIWNGTSNSKNQIKGMPTEIIDQNLARANE